jgi:hypothetical protein
VATMYWYLYLTGEVAVQVGFDMNPLDTAMEAGGPMRDSRHKNSTATDAATVIEGRDPSPGSTSGYASHNGGGHGQLVSSLGRDLSDDSPYTKTHAERTRFRKTSETEKV